MKTACTVQCRECPFRPKALRGYLGSYTVGQVFDSIWRNIPFFCHTKIDYGREDWMARANRGGKVCLGSLVFAKKMMAPMRPDAYDESDPEVIAARAANQDRTDVECMDPKTFMVYHDRNRKAS